MSPDEPTEDYSEDGLQVWFLAFYNDGSGVWGLGESWPEAQERGYQFWADQWTKDGTPCSREEWLAGLVCVEVRTSRAGLGLLLAGLPSTDDLPGDNVRGGAPWSS